MSSRRDTLPLFLGGLLWCIAASGGGSGEEVGPGPESPAGSFRAVAEGLRGESGLGLGAPSARAGEAAEVVLWWDVRGSGDAPPGWVRPGREENPSARETRPPGPRSPVAYTGIEQHLSAVHVPGKRGDPAGPVSPPRSRGQFLLFWKPPIESGSLSARERGILEELHRIALGLELDPRLAVSMAMVESNLDHRAVSPKGAVGVLQVMPQFAWKDFRVTREMLFQPDVNIRIGLTYMKSYLRRFNNNVELSLAAYNAGASRVVRAGFAVPPIKETQQYVKRVKAAMHHLMGWKKPPDPIG